MKRTVQIFRIWFCFLSWLMLAGCGSADSPLSVGLELPAESNADLFWYDVERRELKVSGKGNAQTIPWASGGLAEVEAREGDVLTFSGYDRLGELRVAGTATVSKEKRVLVPLRRTL